METQGSDATDRRAGGVPVTLSNPCGGTRIAGADRRSCCATIPSAAGSRHASPRPCRGQFEEGFDTPPSALALCSPPGRGGHVNHALDNPGAGHLKGEERPAGAIIQQPAQLAGVRWDDLVVRLRRLDTLRLQTPWAEVSPPAYWSFPRTSRSDSSNMRMTGCGTLAPIRKDS